MNKKNVLFIIFIIILIILLIIVTNIGDSKKSVINTPKISSVSDIVKDENIVLIDVRTKEEYDSGHIPRSINIPYTEIENEIDYDKDKPIAVYCRTGKRSKEAALTLEKMGYTKIYDIGGISNYEGELITN